MAIGEVLFVIHTESEPPRIFFRGILNIRTACAVNCCSFASF
jgi:hypothetical protein